MEALEEIAQSRRMINRLSALIEVNTPVGSLDPDIILESVLGISGQVRK